MKKEMNNKGFSLVELIIVIAIMAVLVGVLAPQFLKYVESSRVQKDESAMSEVLNATKIACSVDEVYTAVAKNNGATVTMGNNNQVSADVDELTKELLLTVPDKIDFSSKQYAGTTQTVTVAFGADGTVTVTGDWGTTTP